MNKTNQEQCWMCEGTGKIQGHRHYVECEYETGKNIETYQTETSWDCPSCFGTGAEELGLNDLGKTKTSENLWK